LDSKCGRFVWALLFFWDPLIFFHLKILNYLTWKLKNIKTLHMFNYLKRDFFLKQISCLFLTENRQKKPWIFIIYFPWLIFLFIWRGKIANFVYQKKNIYIYNPDVTMKSVNKVVQNKQKYVSLAPVGKTKVTPPNGIP
jgi:hypothetical protein